MSSCLFILSATIALVESSESKLIQPRHQESRSTRILDFPDDARRLILEGQETILSLVVNPCT